MSEPAFLHVVGACQHNLKGVDVSIPRSAFTVITGLSGSGKSSLAFDTIYAEGQRRYVESLSAHSRQFLEQMPKPDVERIEGLSPTIAIEQSGISASPRSTVGTATEVYDFLRVLFARLGVAYCWMCGRPIVRHSPSAIVDHALELTSNSKVMVLAPMVRQARGGHSELLRRISREGYVRARIDGEVVPLDGVEKLDSRNKHTIEVVVDRLSVKQGVSGRLAESVELALRLSGGGVILSVQEPGGSAEEFVDQRFSTVLSCPYHPEVVLAEQSPRLFSFNSPHGACPSCTGLGTVLEFDTELIIPDHQKSLSEGAVAAWRHGGRKLSTVYAGMIRDFCDRFEVPPDIPVRNMAADARRILLEGTTPEDERRFGAAFEGVLPNLRRRWEGTDSEKVKTRLHAFLSEAPCKACGGSRLRPEALAVRVGGLTIAEVVALAVERARSWFDELSFDGERASIAEPLLREIRHRLAFLCEVGVEYLSLERGSSTLSGGESQRIHLATQIGSGLSGVCYVLDEPTVGLHQRDSQRLTASLKHLAGMGNTVIVVEHDEEVISAADYIIDIGPEAGSHGGEVVAAGTLDEVLACEGSLTGQYLSGRCTVPLPDERRQIDLRRALRLFGASANNLKRIDVVFPLGCFVCVTGVSGSGKSTLVADILLRAVRRAVNGAGPRPGAFDRLSGTSQVDRMIEIDQSPIGRTPRSNPATYSGVFDLIRALYAQTREAKIRGYSASRFSFNVKGGRCEECQGQGTKQIEMHFLPDVYVTCGACRGTRYNRETLEVRYRGKSIADVLDMRVEEAARFFDSFAKIKRLLRALMDVGLGYVSLGQSSVTLSGGEAQRVKLAAELGKPPTGHTLYVLDEPTTGLHAADVHNLLNVLNRLASKGHTVLVIEHNLDVIKMADWVIDLGPEGGDGGGEVVVAGRPEEIAACKGSYTGRFLRKRLGVGDMR